MFESRHQPILPFRRFLTRVTRHLLLGLAIILLSLGIGMVGYHHFEKMSWTDAYVNAAMILSGMGQVSTLQTEEGKLFAGSYALFSGILFLVVIAFMMAPLIHRFFHKLHLKELKK
jgi:hypothetical protein